MVTNNNDSGAGSLRQAILNSNATSGTATNTIDFNVGTKNDIEPTLILPAITHPVVIDGTSDPISANNGDEPYVVLDGDYATRLYENDNQPISEINGLTIEVSGCTVRGLVIIGWGNDGIGIGSKANDEIIQDNQFGVAGGIIGSERTTPNAVAIQVGNSTGDVIGGATPEDTNLIGDSTTAAIELGGTGTNVFNNDIGTSLGYNVYENGTLTDLTFPNATGIVVSGSDNLINANVISGNHGFAVIATGKASVGNLILNNNIGLDTKGLYAIANNGSGVELTDGTSNDQVNGNTIVASNGPGVEVSGKGTNDNTIDGNDIGVLPSNPHEQLGNTGDGVLISGGAQDNTVGSAASPNVISQNGGYGVDITGTGTDYNTVANDFIGTDPTGRYSLGNGSGGVLIASKASDNDVGGSGRGNVISGNRGYGIDISGIGTDANLVASNYIGTDATGAVAVANSGGGVLISGASNNVIGGRGLSNVISGNNGNGLSIISNAATNYVEDNVIGLDASQSGVLGNTGDGVYIASSNNFVGLVGKGGELQVANGNVISGNGNDGVELAGNFAQFNSVLNNIIGTNYLGNVAMPNQIGLEIDGGSDYNNVGGAAPADRNVISGNTRDGVALTGAETDFNTFEGNLIGTNEAGTAALANGRQGVIIIDGANENTFGGPTTSGFLAPGNLISGNKDNGVEITGTGSEINTFEGNLIGVNLADTQALPNGIDGIDIAAGASRNVIGGEAANDANVISGNIGDGVTFFGTGTSQNTALGNFIGTNLGGTAAIANDANGVLINGGSVSNWVGGSLAGNGNVISGNKLDGVLISGAGTNLNNVEGNDIGTVAGGASALPNGGDGVVINDGAKGNTVGGVTDAGERNYVSGNIGDGVSISGNGTKDNAVDDDTIGANASGEGAVANGGDGVVIENGAAGNQVNGSLLSGNGQAGLDFSNSASGNSATGNWIGIATDGNSALPNGTAGVLFQSGASSNTITDFLVSANPNGIVMTGAGTTGNSVAATWIGTNSTDTAAVPNSGAGVLIEDGANGNTIGHGNIISGNGGDGVLITGAGANSNKVQDNTIGTEAGGLTPLPNSYGIMIAGGASKNIIGGPNVGNIIADNTNAGVAVTGNSSTQNTISQNAIFGNGGLGIDLINPNTNGGPQTGPNNLQNAPILTDGSTPGMVSGSLNSSPNTTFTVEFFGSPNSDATEPGQGRDYLGSVKVMTDPLGNASFTFSFTPTAATPYLTATATDQYGNTSEFSPSLEPGLTASGLALNATAGIPFNGTVATFTPGYAGEPLGNFQVTINWGDGQTSTGTVVQGVNNTYNVVGTHTYASPGSLLPVVVTIQDVLGDTIVTANSTMDVTAGTKHTTSRPNAGTAEGGFRPAQKIVRGRGGPLFARGPRTTYNGL